MISMFIYRTVLKILFVHFLVINVVKTKCLTGSMTDIQNWVDTNGYFTEVTQDRDDFIDVSRSRNLGRVLRSTLLERDADAPSIKYLSMAYCNLNYVDPTLFNEKASKRHSETLSQTVEYLSFFGNAFTVHRSDSQYWGKGFQDITFQTLYELDLRNCSIATIPENTFINMPTLKHLYLSGNTIITIYSNAFNGLHQLQHLDISNNQGIINSFNPLYFQMSLFRHLYNLKSLDLSNSRVAQSFITTLDGLGRQFEKLSICNTGLTLLQERVFRNTSLKILDVSNNPNILRHGVFRGIENTLEILYATVDRISDFSVFDGLHNLRMLDVTNNEIMVVPKTTLESLKELRVLIMNFNRISPWKGPLFDKTKNLHLLSLKDNNINVIDSKMLEGFENITFLEMGNNNLVCSCTNRELYDFSEGPREIHFNLSDVFTNLEYDYSLNYHTAVDDLISIIFQRSEKPTPPYDNITFDNLPLLIDYNGENYNCPDIILKTSINISNIEPCTRSAITYEQVIVAQWNKLFLLLILPLLLILIGFLVYFRKNLRYCCITIKNSAVLSLISDAEDKTDDFYDYDVFVSYCNDDRNWVLDELLPQVENEYNIRVCLHERDFQVGLSILENIVNSMDRSKSIILIVSPKFLKSQWCQFEMHLAQHRLLETRREDLIIILLEDIPRKQRPNTLHYLMVTKTYIQWPKAVDERDLFWKRLKKSIIMHNQKLAETINLRNDKMHEIDSKTKL